MLIARGARSIAELPQGARVGTSSLRRVCQLKRLRPDLKLEPVRGNIDTRIRKLETEGLDAIILAMAGLKRMGWEDRATAPIPVEECLPAVGQGALGVECRADDEEMLALLSRYNDEAIRPGGGGGAKLPRRAERRLPGADRRLRRDRGRGDPADRHGRHAGRRRAAERVDDGNGCPAPRHGTGAQACSSSAPTAFSRM